MIYTKQLLSGSTNGIPIKVVATATAGTLIHTAVTGTASLDEIWIWAQNNHTADVVLTIEWGGATAPDCNIIKTIPTKAGEAIIVPGFLLNNGLTVKAFAATADVICLSGFVNRIS
jgi:hypothetical protein